MTAEPRFTPSSGSPAVDQLMRSVGDSEKRSRVPNAHCVLPWYLIEQDVRLEGLTLVVRREPLRERYDPRSQSFIGSPADGRGYVRSARVPHVGYAIDAGDRGSHVKLARRVAAGYTDCDRCGREDIDREIVLIDMPPNYVAVVLCVECLHEVGAAEFALLP